MSRTSSSASAQTQTARSSSRSRCRTYEAIRADPKQFVVLPHHYTPEIEELVVKEADYWIVRKEGEAGDYVEKLDPRGRNR